MTLIGPHRSKNAIAAVLVAVVLFTLGGCWEEIEYTGPDLPVAPPQQTSPLALGGSKTATVDAKPAPQAVVPSSEPEEPSTVLADDAVPTTVVAPPAINNSSAELPEDDRYAMPGETASSTAQDSSPADELVPTGGELEAKTVSAKVDAAEPAQSANTRLAAWTLGSRLSLAALANDRGVAAKSVPKWLDEASAAAETLGASVNALPERAAATDKAPVSSQVLKYLFDDGQRIGRDLQGRYGADHAALVEVGVKSSLLVLLYQPDSTAVESISKALSQAAPRAELPAELWQPLVELLDKRSSIGDVRAGVRRLHADVDRYLAAPVEP